MIRCLAAVEPAQVPDNGLMWKRFEVVLSLVFNWKSIAQR